MNIVLPLSFKQTAIACRFTPYIFNTISWLPIFPPGVAFSVSTFIRTAPNLIFFAHHVSLPAPAFHLFHAITQLFLPRIHSSLPLSNLLFPRSPYSNPLFLNSQPRFHFLHFPFHPFVPTISLSKSEQTVKHPFEIRI